MNTVPAMFPATRASVTDTTAGTLPMLFSDKLLFIHVPKTGGMSVTQFLIDNIADPITLLVPPHRPDLSVPVPLTIRARMAAKRILQDWRVLGPGHVTVAEGLRHERLAEAARALAKFGRRLDDFDMIVSIMRNPYDIEVSRYHFLRRGYLGVPGLSAGRVQKIAFGGDFTHFACIAPYQGRMPARIEDWYELDGRIPQSLRILRYETLEEDLERVVGALYPVRHKLPKMNASIHSHFRDYLNADSEHAIYRKFQWLFDRGYYSREPVPAAPTIQSAEKHEHV